jgi:hypothetical protein
VIYLGKIKERETEGYAWRKGITPDYLEVVPSYVDGLL